METGFCSGYQFAPALMAKMTTNFLREDFRLLTDLFEPMSGLSRTSTAQGAGWVPKSTGVPEHPGEADIKAATTS